MKSVFVVILTLFVTFFSAYSEGLPSSLSGTYVFAGGEKERKELDRVMDAAAAEVNFAVRGLVRKRLAKVVSIPDWMSFTIQSDSLVLRDSFGGNWSGSCDGRKCTAKTLDGDPATFTRKLRRNEDQTVTLVEVRKALEATRTHTYTLSEDGNLLKLATHLVTPKLSKPIKYTLTFRRKNTDAS